MEEIIKANPEGITDEELRTKTPSATPTQRQDAINALLGQGKLGLVSTLVLVSLIPIDIQSRRLWDDKDVFPVDIVDIENIIARICPTY